VRGKDCPALEERGTKISFLQKEKVGTSFSWAGHCQERVASAFCFKKKKEEKGGGRKLAIYVRTLRTIQLGERDGTSSRIRRALPKKERDGALGLGFRREEGTRRSYLY